MEVIEKFSNGFQLLEVSLVYFGSYQLAFMTGEKHKMEGFKLTRQLGDGQANLQLLGHC